MTSKKIKAPAAGTGRGGADDQRGSWIDLIIVTSGPVFKQLGVNDDR